MTITPTARILLDIHDDVAVYHALKEHTAEPGRLRVVPTPGVYSRTAMARDIRNALGLSWGGRSRGDPIPDLLIELRRHEVSEMYVLRANHLLSRNWTLLAEIAVEAPATLAMVVHQFTVRGQWQEALKAGGLVAADAEVLMLKSDGLSFMSRAEYWRATDISWQSPLTN